MGKKSKNKLSRALTISVVKSILLFTTLIYFIGCGAPPPEDKDYDPIDVEKSSDSDSNFDSGSDSDVEDMISYPEEEPASPDYSENQEDIPPPSKAKPLANEMPLPPPAIDSAVGGSGHNSISVEKKLLDGDTSFIKGMTTYYIPDSMPLETYSKVTMSIGVQEKMESLIAKTETLSGAKPKEKIKIGEDILIGRKMKASLTSPDPNAFDIQIVGSSEQIVNLHNNESVDWLWNVKPNEEGFQQLNLTLEVFHKSDLGENYSSIPVYSDEVQVYAETTLLLAESMNDLIESESESTEPTNEFQVFNVLILISVLLIISLLGIWIYRKNKKKVIAKKVIQKYDSKDILTWEELSKNNKIEQALESILNNPNTARSGIKEEAILLLSNNKKNEKERAQGIISFDDYNRTSNRIALSVIRLIADLKDKKTEKLQPLK